MALFDGGRGVGVSDLEVGAEGRRVTMTTTRPAVEGDLDLCFRTLPTGDNGQKATYWAATLGCR